MKVTLKFANGSSYAVLFDAARTVFELKLFIAGFPEVNAPAGRQRLYYNEQLMEDGKTLADYDVDEENCIIFQKDETQIEDLDGVPSGSGVNHPVPEGDALELVLSQILSILQKPTNFIVNESLLNYITEMGFPRPEVRYALNAGLNNPDLAIEFLSEGFPVHDDLALIHVPLDQSAANGDGKNALGFLRANPNFVRVRRSLVARPELMPAVLLSLPDLNPALLTAIRLYPKDFLDMLRANDDPDEEPEPSGITFTPQQQQIFDRIVEMGFPAERVLSAFVACDKNEDKTITFLLSENWDETM